MNAGQVSEVLGLDGRIDYRQLSRLLALADEVSSSVPPHEDRTERRRKTWRQYDQEDVLRIMVIIDLCGGQRAFEVLPGDVGRSRRRMRRLEPVRRACLALVQAYGRPDPLLEIPLVRFGPRVLAFIDGSFEDPIEGGQLAIDGGAPTVGSVGASVRSRHPQLVAELDRRRLDTSRTRPR